ncbi:MAG: FlaG family protein [Wolinella sp.]
MVENIKQQPNIASMPSSSPGIASSSSNAPRGKEALELEKSPTQVAQEQVKELQENKNVEELKKDLMELTEQLNKEFNPLNTNVKFGYSDDIESLYITVSERDTDRVIRKIPSDEAMELMAKMREIVGIIFDKKG